MIEYLNAKGISALSLLFSLLLIMTSCTFNGPAFVGNSANLTKDGDIHVNTSDDKSKQNEKK